MIIDVQKTYKIKPDGKTDNVAALMKMRGALAGSDDHHILIFPGTEKKVLYSDNRWMYGLRSFELVNACIRSSYTGSDEAMSRPLWVGEMFQNNVLGYTGTKIYATADKFKGVKAGSRVIQLITQLNNYLAGDRVMLYFDNYADSGYPPPAKAEWHEIESFLHNDIIILRRPIQADYIDTVWDNPIITGGGCGHPRILNLDRKENPYCKYAKFTSVDFGPGNWAYAAQRVEMTRCKFEDGFFWPSENEIATFEDMDVDRSEFDKLVNTVVCKNVRFNKSANGGGSINSIVVDGCQSAESIRFDSRYIHIKNTHIRGNDDPDPWINSLADYPARNPVRRYTIEDLTFSSGPSSKSDAHIAIAPFNQMTIQVSSSGEIVTKDFDIVKTIEPGTTILFSENGENGGLVTDVTHNGSMFLISGRWAWPQPGSKWLWCHVKEVIDLGGHRALDSKKIWHGNSIRWKGNRTSGIHIMHLNQDDFTGNRLIDVYGYLISIRMFGKGSNIEIQNAYPFGTIPLDFTGYQWVKQLYLIGSGGRFDIIIEWKQY